MVLATIEVPQLRVDKVVDLHYYAGLACSSCTRLVTCALRTWRLHRGSSWTRLWSLRQGRGPDSVNCLEVRLFRSCSSSKVDHIPVFTQRLFQTVHTVVGPKRFPSSLTRWPISLMCGSCRISGAAVEKTLPSLPPSLSPFSLPKPSQQPTGTGSDGEDCFDHVQNTARGVLSSAPSRRSSKRSSVGKVLVCKNGEQREIFKNTQVENAVEVIRVERTCSDIASLTRQRAQSDHS